MPLSMDHIFPLVLACLLGAGILAAVAMLAAHAIARATGSTLWFRKRGGAECKHCRYCYFGCSRLHEETARVEGDDLVEVRCFVCSSCGLPQWTVQRSAVLKKAA